MSISRRAQQVRDPIGNRVAAIGDSITANGNAASGSLNSAIIKPQSYLGWAMLLSGGRVRYAGGYGTGGFTIAQVLQTHVPSVIAAQPAACIVLAGTNDVGQNNTLASMTSGLTSIYKQLLAAGILPICCTIPPRTADNAALKALATQINAWIARFAELNGLPLLDFYALLVNDTNGDYAAGLSVDNIHPNGAGAKMMGQLICDRLAGTSYLALGNGALASLLPSLQPVLAQANPDTSSAIFTANKLFETDSNADGLADGWTINLGAPTPALVADASTKGKLQQITATTAGSHQIQSANSLTIHAGDRIAWAARIGSAVKGVGGEAHFRLCTNDGLQDFISVRNFTEDIANGSVVAGESVVPSGLGSTNLIVALNVNLANAAVARIGQVAVYNLTTLGLA